VQVDLAQSTVEKSKLARASTQVARLEEETTEGVIKEITVEITEGQEIKVLYVKFYTAAVIVLSY